MESTTAGDFIAYPTNRVVGTITDGDQTKRAVEALVKAGFDRDAIEVLHGKQDLRRLDPSGDEHGIFAKLQRSLVRGSVGSEFKHLTYHVGDLEAGRFVVMVLAPERRNRDVAADILHAHGAEFVGFYGRWAYESLPQDSPEAAFSGGRTYDIGAEQETIRIRLGDGAATVVGATSVPANATAVGASLWLVSWRRNDAAIVHVIDVDRGIAYTSLMAHDSAPRHVKGTVTLVE
jgi:hypothetical protein